MLSTNNLYKIYKTKGGQPVNALDGVTITFPEKGMVFLLGKSGSGKSTLLNVCGGLDDPSSGEIIVKGRSSKDFTQSDFDSYRNTCIGFIFQEYNILNEFTVEENIALALELQGKKKDKQKIQELLEQVDLKDYAKRKPNTLSGGQKQRIAIARALIKNPEIIMADEPTGALDSNTGKQVFDTLKKLSKEKLVIVVSHDREFAEFYGDRIIELKDGKILTDHVKVQEDGVSLSENVSILGENTICVNDGATLSKADANYIIEFLKKTNGSVTITNGEKEQKDFKASSRITDDNKIEVFKDVDNNEIVTKEYTKEESRFIRSRLPGRHAFKIGASGLKVKPFRLLLTILLSVVSFVMFGLVSTLMGYDGNEVFGNTLRERNDINSIKFEKKYKETITSTYNGDSNSYTNERSTLISQSDFDKYVEMYGKEVFPAAEASDSIVLDDGNAALYQNVIKYYGYLQEDNTLRNKIVEGVYPQNDDEILITTYTAKAIITGQYSSQLISSNSQNSDITGKKIIISGTTYKVVGILDSDINSIPSDYINFDGKSKTSVDRNKLQKFDNYLSDSNQAIVYLTKNALIKKSKNRVSYDFYRTLQICNYGNMAFFYEDQDNPRTNNFGLIPEKKTPGVNFVFFDSSKTSLTSNEILVTKSIFRETYNDYILDSATKEAYYNLDNEVRNDWTLYTIDDLFPLWDQDKAIPIKVNYQDYTKDSIFEYYTQYKALNDSQKADWIEENKFNIYLTPEYMVNCYWKVEDTIPSTDPNYSRYVSWKTLYNKYLEEQKMSDLIQYYCNGSYGYQDEDTFDWISVQFTDDEINGFLAEILEKEFSDKKFYNLELQPYSNEASSVVGEKKNYKIVGLVQTEGDSWMEAFLFANDAYNDNVNTLKAFVNYQYSTEKVSTKYVDDGKGIYQFVVIPYNHSREATNFIVNSIKIASDDSFYMTNLSIYSSFAMVNLLIENFSKVFLYVGLVLAVFSMLLLANFISISISSKKKEIGILRAVGARSTDVFKIFFSESAVISGICFILSIILTSVGCNYISSTTAAEIGISLFTLTPMTVLLLFGIALITALIATFFPVFSAARKKPVESIRAL